MKIPADIHRREAFRYATGIIAEAEECTPNCSWQEIRESLEEHGFEPLDFVLGPVLD